MVRKRALKTPIKQVFDFNILIGGTAGQGIQTMGTMLGTILFRGGLYVFSLQDYQSRIRGGHNTFRIRVSNDPLSASTQRIDLLVVMNEESYRLHLKEVVPGGIILYDAGAVRPPAGLDGCAGIPMGVLAQEHVGDKKLINTVALGAVLGVLGYDFSILQKTFEEKFKKKGPEIIERNMKAARAGYDHAYEHFNRAKGSRFPIDARFQKKQEILKRSKVPKRDGRILITGSEAGAFGMLAAGVRFYSAYPMTPSTGLLNYLAAKSAAFNIMVEQAEDEIAAIQMVLGASYAGARAAVGTSGGGFALMVESVSLAGITETPVVVYVIQRPGPATGLPTRTEQGDLSFILHAGHGEFPRFVFAPGDPTEMFETSLRAFDLAEKYQVPVLILGDQYLADSCRVVNSFDVGSVRVDRHILPAELQGSDYLRYKDTPDGISPRGVPGNGKGLVIVDSDEHDEAGHLTEDLQVRVQQMNKRMRKLISMEREMSAPTVYGDTNAHMRLVCWGSTLGIAREAVDLLRTRSYSVSLVHFKDIWPFPRTRAIEALRGASRLIALENNYSAPLASLIRAETGISIEEKVVKYNGMQFFPEEVVKSIHGNTG